MDGSLLLVSSDIADLHCAGRDLLRASAVIRQQGHGRGGMVMKHGRRQLRVQSLLHQHL